MTDVHEVVVEVDLDAGDVDRAIEEMASENFEVRDPEHAVVRWVRQVAAPSRHEAYRRAANTVEATILGGGVIPRMVDSAGGRLVEDNEVTSDD